MADISSTEQSIAKDEGQPETKSSEQLEENEGHDLRLKHEDTNSKECCDVDVVECKDKESEEDKYDEASTNLSEELANDDEVDDLNDPSISENEIEDHDSICGDTWIEELECALLADCDPATLKKISEGKRIPAALRPDYWRALLALNDTGKVKLTGEYDLENQLEIRNDCDALVNEISENLAPKPLSDADKLRLKSDFESTLTTYVKARPELSYIPGNGWTDILRVLYNLELNDIQLYQMFFRIVDRYIPKDLSYRQSPTTADSITKPQKDETINSNIDKSRCSKDEAGKLTPETKSSDLKSNIDNTDQLPRDRQFAKRHSIQAYHLLRLLIQYHDPELCSILDSKKVTPDLYVKDWFCSLFARSCSPKLALLIWDTHFKMADPFLIFFAAIVMVANASDELKKSNMVQADMLRVLKAMPSRLEEDDIEDLYYLVSNHYTNSTPRSIRSYSHLFFMDTFGNTYQGNESPEESPPLLDLRTTQLTSSLDLSQYLCLPIVPAEIFSLDAAQIRSSPTQSTSTLRYFLVDCRPAEQYNVGHLQKAFHLDCSLMLREPSSFATAVQVLLEIQHQVVKSKSNTGGQHLCFIGSGQEEEDQYVNMVVASFLQKYQKYVSIVVGGFEAIHDYVNSKAELKESFNKFIVDHNEELCKACLSKIPNGLDKLKARKANLPASGSGAQSIFTTTANFLKGDRGTLGKLASNPQASAAANLIAQSGASMFEKFLSKSTVIKDRLVETLNTTTISSATIASNQERHVSSSDKLGRRYTGGNIRYAIDDNDVEDLNNRSPKESSDAISEPIQEIQIETWQKQIKLIGFYKCAQIKGTNKYPGYIALSTTHLWILREIPHNKGFASIAAKRPLDMIVQITSKRRQPDQIIFRYGYAINNESKPQQNQQQQVQQSAAGTSDNVQAVKHDKPAKSLPPIVASDHLHIPQAFEVIRLIKREIVRIMDETSRGSSE